jgi:hypothetical protein
MASLRITCTSAAAVAALIELLGERGLTARPTGRRWQVEVDLDDGSLATAPLTLAAARDWLHQTGLPSAAISLDGQEHVLYSDEPAPAA